MSLYQTPQLPDDDNEAITQLIEELSRWGNQDAKQLPYAPPEKTVTELISDLRNKNEVGLQYLRTRRSVARAMSKFL